MAVPAVTRFPKEGTILTVARGGAEKCRELAGCEDILAALDQILEHMEVVLEHTPELLPVLKEAGVVDSGGQGLLEFMKGVKDGLLGKEVNLDEAPAANKGTGAASNDISTADIKYGYCTEFIILLEKPFEMKDEAKFKSFLESIGDSIVLVSDSEIVKVHVHTNDPGLAIQKALTYGQLSRMKIDNMREEHQERLIKDAEKVAAETATVEKTSYSRQVIYRSCFPACRRCKPRQVRRPP